MASRLAQQLRDEAKPKAGWHNIWNWVWLLVMLVGVGVSFGFHQKAQAYKYRAHQVSQQAAYWQNKVNKLEAKNNRIIYLPKHGDIHLTNEQTKSVQFLMSFASQITNFDGQTDYNTNYRYAKTVGIHDPKFWSDFMQSPYDNDHNPVIKLENLRLSNVRTQVIVTGDNTYIVLATYIPYHNTSDLYQKKHLRTQTYVFDVQGQKGNWTKFQLMPGMNSNEEVVNAGDLEK